MTNRKREDLSLKNSATPIWTGIRRRLRILSKISQERATILQDPARGRTDTCERTKFVRILRTKVIIEDNF